MRWIAAVVLFSLYVPVGKAGQINWAGAFGAVNLTSTGAAMDGQMIVELGVFAPGFTPSAGNVAVWATNWRRASLALYNPESRHFTGAHQVTSNEPPFTLGTKGYIWGHDGNCTDGEWILLSAPAWTWPSSQNPLELPVNWTVSTANQVTVGQANSADFSMKSAKVSAPLPVATWTEWQAKAFNPVQLANPAFSGPNADPDADGLVNLAEFALGGHPLLAEHLPARITPGMALSGGRQRLTITVKKRCDRAINWSAQASMDLINWPVGSTVVRQNNTELFEVIENVTGPADQRAFLRLVMLAP